MAEWFNAPLSKSGIPQGIVSSNLTISAERNFRIRKVGRSPRRRRGSGQKSPSLRDELGRDGCGEMGGFVTNQRVRSDFLDERLDLVQIRGGGQKIGLFRI